MKRVLALVAAVAGLALAAAGPAAAWEGVTVRLSPPPEHPRAGALWTATLEVLNPEGKPFSVAMMAPGVTIAQPGSGERRTFLAEKTSRDGVFTVRIVFPRSGTWSYRADAVSGQPGAPSTRYEPVRVGARARSFPVERSAAAGAAAVLLGAGALALARRRRRGTR
ncbi:MAG TPA: hypothetical protein VF063_10285 [Gaiellaceae bacterium]